MIPVFVVTCLLLSEQTTRHGSGAEHVLDLVTYNQPDHPKPLDDPLEIPSGIVGGVDHQQARTEAPLRVTLASIAPDLLRAGDPFVYELLVENIGKNVVRMPWSPEQHLFSRRMRHASVASISLSPAKGTSQVIVSVALFGAEAVPGSLLGLAPGEKALIRAPGLWTLPDPTNASATVTGSIRVVARVTVFSASGVVGPVQSQNNVGVSIR